MLGDSQFRNAGVRVGRLFGIEIWLHWILLAILAIRLLGLLLKSDELFGNPLANWLCFSASLLVSILLHELGHCYAGFRMGGSADRIVLWPLGGLAYVDAPSQPRHQFWVAAGGPVVNAILAVLAAVVCAAAGWSLFPFGEAGFEPISYPRLFVQYLFVLNLALFIVNLVPCWPLDGGRILHTWLWHRMGTHGGALLLTLNISRVVAILALAFFGFNFILGFAVEDFPYRYPLVDQLGTYALLMGILYFMDARVRRFELQYGEGEDEGIFGYDFSSGYTSLERSAPGDRQPSWLERRREERRRKQDEQQRREDRAVRQRLDELLEKIHREGMSSLSREEQRFLARASRHVRESAAREE